MKVFISWSGERSRELADFLNTWLRQVLQQIEPWMSGHGIEKGSLWDTTISAELKDSPCGILCLTSDNLTAPWIHFEAGALFKGDVNTRVYTLLLDIEHSSVQQPLAKFNHTGPTHSDILKMLTGLNSHCERPLPDDILKKVFDKNWSELEEILTTLRTPPKSAKPAMPAFSSEAALKEILEGFRNMERRIAASRQGPPERDLRRHAEQAYRQKIMADIDIAREEIDMLETKLEQIEENSVHPPETNIQRQRLNAQLVMRQHELKTFEMKLAENAKRIQESPASLI